MMPYLLTCNYHNLKLFKQGLLSTDCCWDDHPPLPPPLGPGGRHTCVRPVVVLHGGGREEGVMAGRPGTLEWLLPRVEFHVVVQGPLLCETSITQAACKLPAWSGEKRMQILPSREHLGPRQVPLQPCSVASAGCREENCGPGLSCLYNQALIFLSRPGTSAIYSLLCGWAQRVWKILLQSSHPWGKCENRFHLYRPTPLIQGTGCQSKG